MAGQRLTDKSALAQQPASDDLLMVVDASDTTGSAQGTSKKIEAKNVFTVKSVSLSSAQIQALHTTPIELIAAPGSGYSIMIHSILVDGIYGTTTEANKRTLIFAYGTPSFFPPPSNDSYNITNWMFNAAASRSVYATPFASSASVAENQPWKVITSASITADFTAVIHIAHTIIKL
jgi:hypothetical protein